MIFMFLTAVGILGALIPKLAHVSMAPLGLEISEYITKNTILLTLSLLEELNTIFSNLEDGITGLIIKPSIYKIS